ncbi:MAG: serine hydrolase domain-containing protein [Myxococcota bacterium]|nr:serine hydrolase domain-containing protein [Myxococcota bacterium]
MITRSVSTENSLLWNLVLFASLLGCRAAKDPVLEEWTTLAPELPQVEFGGEFVLDISDLVAIERANSNLPALGGGIIVGDRILAMGVSGTRKATEDTPVTLNDQWHIGSITKSVTATLTAILIEEGVLSWDTVVTEVFPNDTIHEGWHDVRVIDLIRHRAGVSEPNLAAVVRGRTTELPPEIERVNWLFRDIFPEAPRSREFHYSNGGYILLGAMLEKLTDTPWQDLVRKHIFEPLQLSGSGFGAPQGDQPWGHHYSQHTGPIPIFPSGMLADNPPVIGPAGTLHMTLRDLGRYVQEHLHLYNDRSDIWSGEAFDALHDPEEFSPPYAGGWAVDEDSPILDSLFIHHNGSNSLWLAKAGFAPDKNMVLFCTSNYFDRGKADEVCQDLFEHIAHFEPILEHAEEGSE